MPVVQGNFSNICCSISKGNTSDVRNIIIRVFSYFTAITLFSYMVNILIGSWILDFIFGRGYSLSELNVMFNLICIMLVIQLVISYSIILVNLIIIPAGYSYYLKRAYFWGLFLYVVSFYPVVNIFDIYGVPIAILLVEASIVIHFVIFVRNKMDWLFQK